MTPYIFLAAPAFVLLQRLIAIIIFAVYGIDIALLAMPIWKGIAAVVLALALITPVRFVIQEYMAFQNSLALFSLATSKDALQPPDTREMMANINVIMIVISCLIAVVLL